MILKDIIYKYTNVLIDDCENIVDNSYDIIENSIFILDKPNHINIDFYRNNIITHLKNKNLIATLFINGSEKYFSSIDLDIFGKKIFISKEISEKIIDEYYYKTPEKILAVTGTYGKTSTTYFLHYLLEEMGEKSVLINTTGLFGLDKKFLFSQRNTTNSYCVLKKILHLTAIANIKYIIIEISSHGIKNNRIKNIKFNGGIFTSFTSDHLEFHSSLEDYFYTKHDFIKTLPIQIINENIFKSFPTKLNPTHIYGKEKNQISNSSFLFNNEIISVNFSIEFFQKENLLAAALLLFEIGFKKVFNFMNIKKQISCRMHLLGKNSKGALIYCDSAFRLETIISIVDLFSKKFSKKNIILIIGLGGDRKRGETFRQDVGEISLKVGKMIITDDNPRNESPIEIRHEMMISNHIWNIGNRIDALFLAFEIAEKDQVILILGKAEKTIIYKNHITYISDEEIYQQYILNKL